MSRSDLYPGREFVFTGIATGATYRGFLVEWIEKYGFWWVNFYPGCSLCKGCKAMAPGWLYEGEFTPTVDMTKINPQAWNNTVCDTPPF